MEWETYWSELLKKEKIIDIADELAVFDEHKKGDSQYTKNICKHIYQNYDTIKNDLTKVKNHVENMIKDITGIHLSTGRVKELDSLIVKIIKKRREYGAGDNKYAKMDAYSVKDALTDLVGLKFIVNYRGNWLRVHNEITNIFRLLPFDEYSNNERLEHRDYPFIAEQPLAYYAKGDTISEYEENGVKTKQHNAGYRSIHYILSVDNTYVELQVRTIYDEAWSDCDHRYVYKQEANPNNVALRELSSLLCKLTNAANDIGDMMHEIYNQKSFSKVDNDHWVVGKSYKDTTTKVKKQIEEATKQFDCFDQKLEVEGDGE